MTELTYEQATDLCLKSRWKISFCKEGKDCWCRLIVPEEAITDKDGNEIYIVGSGSIPTVYAEHVVKLHNEFISKK